MSLDLAGFSAGLVNGLHTVEEAVPPAHEGLRVDIFVIFHEIQAAAQRLIHDTSIIAGGKTELWLGGRTEQRAAILVQVLALHDDTMWRPLKGLHIVRRDAHILQP